MSKDVEYVCYCPGLIFWLVCGVLMITSGLTSLLYISNMWTITEVQYLGAAALTIVGIYITVTVVRK